MERVLRQSYEGFLSEPEINDLLKGVDIWLDAEQWVERHEARNEYIQQKLAEFKAEQELEAELEQAEEFRGELDKLKEYQAVQESIDALAGAAEGFTEVEKTFTTRKPRKKAQEA
jgi:oligoendopeptidase F